MCQLVSKPTNEEGVSQAEGITKAANKTTEEVFLVAPDEHAIQEEQELQNMKIKLMRDDLACTGGSCC